MLRVRFVLTALIAALATSIACGGKQPPVAKPTTPPSVSTSGGGTAPTGPVRPPEPPPVPVDTTPTVTAAPDPYANKTTEEINKDSPLRPVYFAYDSDELDDLARRTLEDNASVLKKYGTWVITVEGHCDERGSAEYNLALGDRRALAAKNYLTSLGVTTGRLRTVSYGKEFPFDPGHDEPAYSKNRRAHFMLTSK